MITTTKKIIAGVGILAYIGYIKLSMHLGRATVNTSNYIANENNKSFFLNLDIQLPVMIKIMPNYKIDKITLIINNEKIATSLAVLSDEFDFRQEFLPIVNANYKSLSEKRTLQKSIVEIKYKTFLGLKITKRYEVKNGAEGFYQNPGNGTPIIPQNQTCSCESLNNKR